MLSKHMTYSLMILITIFALAFVAPSVIAQDFDATFSAMDVSFAGDTQIDASVDTAGSIDVYLTFGHVVNLAAVDDAFGATADADGTGGGVVNVYNKFGALIDATSHTVAVTQRDLDPGTDVAAVRNDGKSYMLAIAGLAVTDNDNTNPVKVEIFLAEGKINNANPAEDKKNKKGGPFIVNLVGADAAPSTPMPVSIILANNLLVPAAGFTGDKFGVIVTLTEEPKEGKFTKDHLDVAKGTASDGVYLMAVDPDTDGDGSIGAGETAATGRSEMHYQYLVTITPAAEDGDLVIKLKSFEDQNMPTPNKYMPPTNDTLRMEELDQLTVKIKKATVGAPKTSGTTIYVHHREGNMIPANGFNLVLYDGDKNGSGIAFSHEKDDENLAHKQSPAQLLFNTRPSNGQMPNLETFLANGGTIDLMGPDGTAKGSVIISEIMWGSDASLDAHAAKSQWLELQNMTSSAISIGEKKWSLIFYSPADTLPTTGYVDRVGTVGVGGYWSIAGKGQSGRSHIEEGDPTAILGHIPIISMQRVIDAAGMAADGTMASSWAASVPPALNFKSDIEGVHVATPGAAPITYPAPPVAEAEPEAAPVVPVAMADEIMISEIMVDTDNGRLPQWIELTYSGMAKASLEGWSIVIDNAIDAGVLGGGNAITVSLGDAMVDVSKNTGNMGKGQSVLVVAWPTTRHSANIPDARVINVASQLGQTSRYQLLSYNGFRITLVPPDQEAIAAFGDIAGNLHEDWDIPMSEGSARSSLIRYDMLADGTMTMGTDANGWVLADSTDLATGPESFYGDDEDSSTPGQHAGGPLPVELSHFRPARDKATGAVVITWATQSELNNAGFFIKRSQQRDGEFKVINTAMVPGAGTTSEKQFYTYTDTTAQPNVVYYYQIEDVSLDGNRQTLTRGIRLKGHIGAAGKATTLWGELKSSNE